ncbi:MAG: hypothetical protein E5X74_04700 [Mesorhizobium sp.]|uniref:hypothetical protein n=1 Tax=Mesorhizobium sp. TaxID=1871066 RepID=UPI0012090546|nr:hypothetical protein [Mesorhizobium sp.]TIO76077.1 MAG: hypothetical protein E5X75_16430 [Mesorhizobium sp.]TIO87244.1 MAG: hypothetical protein E5X74_04700 [Mesorhizobium sp.]
MRARTAVAVVGGLILLALAWLAAMPHAARQLSFTKDAYVDRGTYFRLKVDFAYKGEQQHYDIVVGCNVLNIHYKDSSSTYEAGLIPTVWGQGMSDGKAVVVRAPDACRGDTTANGGVPADFLPVMVVYDNADTVAFGMGYMTDDAYRSPKSVLRFDKATVERATRAEFDAFRGNGPQNVITRSQYHSAQNGYQLALLGLARTYPAFGRSCSAFSRWKLTESEREIVRKYRPANAARYWTISDTAARAAYANEIREARKKAKKQTRDDDLILGFNEGFWQPDFGALRRDGVQLAGLRGSTERAAAFYPADTSMRQDKWPVERTARIAAYEVLQSVNTTNIDIDGGRNRGFAYCYSGEAPPRGALKDKVWALPAVTTVDGQELVTGAPEHWGFGFDRALFVFDNDEYVLERVLFNLESTRGDV